MYHVGRGIALAVNVIFTAASKCGASSSQGDSLFGRYRTNNPSPPGEGVGCVPQSGRVIDPPLQYSYSPNFRNSAGSMGFPWQVTLKWTWGPRAVSVTPVWPTVPMT